MDTAHPRIKQLNIIIAAILLLAALIMYFTVPAAVLTGDDPTVDDVKAGLAMNIGWKAAFHEGLNKALQPAIFDRNLNGLSVALHVKSKTVCYFPAVNEWTQCNGQRSCIRGTCKNREWLGLDGE